MYRLITVPLDGTAESEHALPWALALARVAGCEIELVHAASRGAHGRELYPATHPTPDESHARTLAEHRMQRLADEVAREGGGDVHVTAVVLPGADAIEALVEHITHGHTDLVVMTAHRHGRLAHLVLGDVSERLVRHVSVPVLVTRPRPGIPELALQPQLEHILVPLDGSEFAERIVPHAQQLAALLHARMTLLSVVAPVVAQASAATAGTETGLSETADERAGPHLDSAALQRIAEPLRAQGIGVDTEVVVDGRPAAAITEYADKHGADLIAMTTHGRGAVKRFFAGSVAEGVLRDATAALLVLRPVN
jgi:nucleotide-binding universal stress UspA family protein